LTNGATWMKCFRAKRAMRQQHTARVLVACLGRGFLMSSSWKFWFTRSFASE
jgi:hypothetical protein